MSKPCTLNLGGRLAVVAGLGRQLRKSAQDAGLRLARSGLFRAPTPLRAALVGELLNSDCQAERAYRAEATASRFGISGRPLSGADG